jgi:hypothetical protein
MASIARSRVRQDLRANLRSIWRWRRSKADEYPDDPRNKRSAEALWLASEWVGGINLKATLPEGFERIFNQAQKTGLAMWGEESKRVASRFFFDQKDSKPTPSDFDRLLIALESAMRDDAEENQRELSDEEHEVVIRALREIERADAEDAEPPSPRLELVRLDEFPEDVEEVPIAQRLDAIEEKLDRVLDLLT